MNWDLSKLYAGFDAPEFLSDVDAFRALADALFAEAKSLEVRTDTLEALLRRMETLAALGLKTFSFVELTMAADANNAPAMAAYGRLMPVMNRVEEVNSALAAKLGEVKDLDDIIAASPLLSAHAYLLRTLQGVFT